MVRATVKERPHHLQGHQDAASQDRRAARAERLAQSLRANLQRRKSQARARNEQPADPPEGEPQER